MQSTSETAILRDGTRIKVTESLLSDGSRRVTRETIDNWGKRTVETEVFPGPFDVASVSFLGQENISEASSGWSSRFGGDEGGQMVPIPTTMQASPRPASTAEPVVVSEASSGWISTSQAEDTELFPLSHNSDVTPTPFDSNENNESIVSPAAKDAKDDDWLEEGISMWEPDFPPDVQSDVQSEDKYLAVTNDDDPSSHLAQTCKIDGRDKEDADPPPDFIHGSEKVYPSEEDKMSTVFKTASTKNETTPDRPSRLAQCNKSILSGLIILVLCAIAGVSVSVAVVMTKKQQDDEPIKIQGSAGLVGYNYSWPSEEGWFVAPSYVNSVELPHEKYTTDGLEECTNACGNILASSGVFFPERTSHNCICDLASECMDPIRKTGAIVFSKSPKKNDCASSYCDYFSAVDPSCNLSAPPTSAPNVTNSSAAPDSAQPQSAPQSQQGLVPTVAPTIDSCRRGDTCDWSQLGRTIYGANIGDFAGTSVALSADGNVLGLGGVATFNTGGTARIFVRRGSSWIERGQPIEGVNNNDRLGLSLSMNFDGSIVAVGGDGWDGEGANKGVVRVFKYDTTQNKWVQRGADLEGSASFDRVGWSVALSADGNTVALGAAYSPTGYTRVFRWRESAWDQQGKDIVIGDGSGHSIDLSSGGNVLAIGSVDGSFVSVYELGLKGSWEPRGNMIVGDIGTHFGSSLQLNNAGDVLAVGAPYDGTKGSHAGLVRVFSWSGTSWEPIGDIYGTSKFESTGSAVAMDSSGYTIAVGAPGTEDRPSSTKLYDWDGSGWQSRGSTLVGDVATVVTGDRPSLSLALSSNAKIVAVGSANTGDSGSVTTFVWDVSSPASPTPTVASTPTEPTTMSSPTEPTSMSSPAEPTAMSSPVAPTPTASLPTEPTSMSSPAAPTVEQAVLPTPSPSVLQAPTAKGNAPFNDGTTTTMKPEAAKSSSPTPVGPTAKPIVIPTAEPTVGPTAKPTTAPTAKPSADPTLQPTAAPVTSAPSPSPTKAPSPSPTQSPTTLAPSPSPTFTKWNQVGKAIHGMSTSDYVGTSTAMNIDGSIVAVGGAFDAAGLGLVRVYIRAGPSTWLQLGQTIEGKDYGDRLGLSLAIDDRGYRIAIGSDGHGKGKGAVRIYQYSDDSFLWSQLGPDIEGDSSLDAAGWSISLSSDGNVVAFAAPGGLFTRVLSWKGNTWARRGPDIEGESHSIKLSGSGDAIVIGSPDGDFVRVFKWNGSTWKERGSGVNGRDNKFGASVDLSSSGDVLAVGAPYDYQAGSNAGRACVYYWNGSSWIKRGQDLIGATSFDYFGFTVSLSNSGSVLAVGAPGPRWDDVPWSTRVYDWDNSGWVMRGTEITGDSNSFGSLKRDISFSVALSSDGNNLAVGSPLDNKKGDGSGTVRVYRWGG